MSASLKEYQAERDSKWSAKFNRACLSEVISVVKSMMGKFATLFFTLTLAGDNRCVEVEEEDEEKVNG